MAANLVSTASTSGPSRPFCALPASLFQLDGSLFNSPVQDKRRKAWERKGEMLHVSASRAANWVSRMGGTRVLHNAFGLKGLLVKQGSLVTFIVGRNAHFPQKLSDESYQGCVDSSLSEAPLTRLLACTENSEDRRGHQLKLSKKNTYVHRRSAMAFIFSSFIFFHEWRSEAVLAQPSTVFREYVDAFDGYTFKFPQNWIQFRGAGADIFYRDPFVLDENLSVGFSSPSSSRYISVEDLGSPQEAGKKILRQYLTEFMSTRLGVRRESSILSTSSRIADDGRLYYQVEVNIKSYANNNELAVMPEDRVVRLEWDRRYLSVLGVENSRLYELRLQTPEKVFREEENDLREVMSSFRVMKVVD